MADKDNEELRDGIVSHITENYDLQPKGKPDEGDQEEEILSPEEQERRNRFEAGKDTRYAGLTEDQIDLTTEEHIQRFGATPVARAAFSMRRSENPQNYDLSECYVERNSDLDRYGRL